MRNIKFYKRGEREFPSMFLNFPQRYICMFCRENVPMMFVSFVEDIFSYYPELWFCKEECMNCYILKEIK